MKAASPGHVDLVLEEDVVKGSLQVGLIPDIALVIVTIHLHQYQKVASGKFETRQDGVGWVG